jgi:hypothetical protein
MVEVHNCELEAQFSALLNTVLVLFALLGYHGYITYSFTDVTVVTKACNLL